MDSSAASACSVEGCEKPKKGSALCSTHYQKEWRRKNPEKWKAIAKRTAAKPESKAKRKESNRAWQRRNRDRINKWGRENNDSRRNTSYKKRFGITLDDYNAMYAAQDGKCAICRGIEPGKGKHFHVDHDHSTGVVRGLLCHFCNTALGLFRDNADRCNKGAEYLKSALAPVANR